VSKILALDGQIMHVVERPELQALVAQAPPDSSGPLSSLVRWMAGFVLSHDGFALGWQDVPNSALKLWLVLYNVNDSLVRVEIENISCTSCENRVQIANPTGEDMFIGQVNKSAARARAWGLAQVPCPTCGAKLPRPSVWAKTSLA
jgi:hypothetical protein